METQKIELVSPVIVDDIELYISADGQDSGMSVSGLARFIGKPESTLRDRLKPILEAVRGANNEFTSLEGVSSIPQSLKHLAGKASTVRGAKNAKILPSFVCADIISYYAYEENHEQAVFAYDKFAQKGLHQWIKESVGYIEQQNNDKLLSLMQEVLQKVDTLTEVSKKYTAIREKTTTVMPGANALLDKLEEPSDNVVLAPESGVFPDGKYSLEAWLHYEKRGLTMPKNTFLSLSHVVAGTYRSLVGKDPEKRHCVVDGRKKYNVSVYAREHFAILQIALNKFFD